MDSKNALKGFQLHFLWCRKQEAPKEIRLVNALPRNAMGKLQKGELKRLLDG